MNFSLKGTEFYRAVPITSTVYWPGVSLRVSLSSTLYKPEPSSIKSNSVVDDNEYVIGHYGTKSPRIESV